MGSARRAVAGMLCVAGLAATLAACGGQPAVCDDMDALRASLNSLKDVNVSQDGLAQLDTRLSAVRSDLAQLRDDASAQYSPEVGKVDAAAQQVSSSIKDASSDPSASTLTALGADLSALGSAVSALGDAVANQC